LPEHLRWTSWLVNRDRKLESLIVDKVLAARRYYAQVLNEFDRAHRLPAPLTGDAGDDTTPLPLPDLRGDDPSDIDAPWALPTTPIDRPRAALAAANF